MLHVDNTEVKGDMGREEISVSCLAADMSDDHDFVSGAIEKIVRENPEWVDDQGLLLNILRTKISQGQINTSICDRDALLHELQQDARAEYRRRKAKDGGRGDVESDSNSC